MNQKENIVEKVVKCLKNIENENPLTICITNAVTINDCANGILAINGSPAMTDYNEDIGDLLKIAKALVVNLGMLSNDKIKGIKKGCEIAKNKKIPIILDPVAVGVTENRNKLILELLSKYNFVAIRGNISEIKAIAKLLNLKEIENNGIFTAKGVDASENDLIDHSNLYNNVKIVKSLAKKLNSVIIASGPIDIISNGKKSYKIENGDEMMAKITGSGCVLSSIIGTAIASNNPLIGAITGTLIMGIAGEQAREYVKKENSGTGTFRVKLIDYLSIITKDTLKNREKIDLIN